MSAGVTGLLDGRTAIVTGGASPRGLGLATARLFAEHGARVLLLDLDEAAAQVAAASLAGAGHLGGRCDVTDKKQCEAAVARALAEGARTADLGGRLSTREMGDRVLACL